MDTTSPHDPHPLDRPVNSARLHVIRVLCAAFILFSMIVMIGVVGTVTFALGGKALPKNGALLGGVPILTVIAAVLTMSAVAVGLLVERFLTVRELRAIATEPNAEEPQSQRLLTLYAKIKFTLFALAEGACVSTAIMYHLSADILMIAFAAGMTVFMLTQFPTAKFTRRWYDGAVATVEGMHAP